jgi:hypothetical protein
VDRIMARARPLPGGGPGCRACRPGGRCRKRWSAARRAGGAARQREDQDTCQEGEGSTEAGRRAGEAARSTGSRQGQGAHRAPLGLRVPRAPQGPPGASTSSSGCRRPRTETRAPAWPPCAATTRTSPAASRAAASRLDLPIPGFPPPQPPHPAPHDRSTPAAQAAQSESSPGPRNGAPFRREQRCARSTAGGRSGPHSRATSTA